MRIFSSVSCAISLVAMLAVPSKAVVTAQWSFDGNLNDTAVGGTVADNLTDNIDGGASYVPGIVGQAVIIADTATGSNKLTAADSADVRLGANWTMEAFFQRDAGNDPAVEWERAWTKWGEGGEDYHFSFRGAAGAPVQDGLDLFVNGSNNIINHNSTFSVGQDWVHVALIGDQGADTITAWLNGVERGTTAYIEVVATAGNMNFGNFAGGNQSIFQFSGAIDEALIHDEAVSAAYLAARTALIPEPSGFVMILLAGLVGLRRRR